MKNKSIFLMSITFLMLTCVGVTVGFRTTAKIGDAYVLYKFDQGRYLPLPYATALVSVMYIWNSVYRSKYYYELHDKISPEMVKEVTSNSNFLGWKGLPSSIWSLFKESHLYSKHYVANVPALHSVLVISIVLTYKQGTCRHMVPV